MRYVAGSIALLLAMATMASAQGATVLVRGAVRDSATSAGVAGAIVDVRSATYQSAVRSDESGAFRIGDVPEGTYHLTVLRIGYRKIERDIQLTKTGAPLAIVIIPVAERLSPVRVGAEGAGIYGVVGDAKDLRPLSGIKIYITGANESVMTDSTGAFFAPIKKPGLYVVRMTGKGFGEEMFPIDVPAEHVVDASRLLDESDEAPLPAGLFEDFDQRLRWRSFSHSALVTGSELREVGGGVLDGLKASPSMVSKGLRFGASACLILNGSPKPGWPIDAIRPEEIEAIEVYASDPEVTKLIGGYLWPRGARCGPGDATAKSTGPQTVRYVVIWTKR